MEFTGYIFIVYDDHSVLQNLAASTVISRPFYSGKLLNADIEDWCFYEKSFK